MLEWHNLLRELPVGEAVLAAWFQSVTPRTAGFNTVDYGSATAATLYLTVFLMFIGASPGSTGGGIKTTSCGLVVALFRARWRGRGRATLFRRTVPHEAMDRAVTLTLLSLALVATSVLVLGLRGAALRSGQHQRAAVPGAAVRGRIRLRDRGPERGHHGRG